jgi:hypothetical protein
MDKLNDLELLVRSQDMADYWEDLPEGSFKAQGTGVNVALMVIDSTENKGGDVQNALTVNT